MSASACNYIDEVYSLYEYNVIGIGNYPSDLDGLLENVLNEIDIFTPVQEPQSTTCTVISLSENFCTTITITDLTPTVVIITTYLVIGTGTADTIVGTSTNDETIGYLI